MIRSLSIAVLLFTSLAFSHGQDSLHVELRGFDAEVLEEYKENDAFVYDEAEFEQSKIQAILEKIGRWFRGASVPNAEKGVRSASEIIKYGIVALALVGIVWFLLKADFSKIIAKKEEAKKRYVEELDIRVGENILLANLEKAKLNKKYREAVRFQYLLAIKSLDEKDIIRWREWKLSTDYLAELEGHHLQAGFEKLTEFFNFSWYGKRELNESMFAEVETTFNDFRTDLKKN